MTTDEAREIFKDFVWDNSKGQPPVHVVQFGECSSCENHKQYIADLRAALVLADDLLTSLYVGNELNAEDFAAAFNRHDDLGCSSEAHAMQERESLLISLKEER